MLKRRKRNYLPNWKTRRKTISLWVKKSKPNMSSRLKNLIKNLKLQVRLWMSKKPSLKNFNKSMTRNLRDGLISKPNLRRKWLKPKNTWQRSISKMTSWRRNTPQRLSNWSIRLRMKPIANPWGSKSKILRLNNSRRLSKLQSKNGRRTKLSINRSKNSWSCS